MCAVRTHCSAVKDRPQAAPDTERRAARNGEPDMVGGTNATGQADEAAGDGIADPNAEPRLPPRQAADDHGRRDHPGVDVERVGDPEANEVPGSPLAPLGLDGLEVVVRQLARSADRNAGKTGLRPAQRRGGVRRDSLVLRRPSPPVPFPPRRAVGSGKSQVPHHQLGGG